MEKENEEWKGREGKRMKREEKEDSNTINMKEAKKERG